MENLVNFMTANRMTQEAFAALVGLSRSYIAEISSGAKRPGRKAMERIEQATNGAVPAAAWFEKSALAMD